MARLEAEVAELKRNEALSKKKAVEDFKSSDDFQEAVVTLARVLIFARGNLLTTIPTSA